MVRFSEIAAKDKMLDVNVTDITTYDMAIARDEDKPAWLLFVFSLPAKKASQRVEIWRLLKRYGSVALPSSGYVLPNTPQNLERFEWLAASIRKYRGEASVIRVESIDNLPPKELGELFREARSKDYEVIMLELKRRKPGSGSGPLRHLRHRFEEIVAIDFFNSPLRSRVEQIFANADAPCDTDAGGGKRGSRQKKEFQKRIWMTRPRPGIDRVSSAWLILRFIDPQARFTFGTHPEKVAAAVAFDMFQSDGFGHRGDDCTFETLCKEFQIRDPRVKMISQIIHDADLGDEKFGRSEGIALDRVLIGWAQQDLSDEDLLQRGIELIEGLYRSLR
jgi:hypothetical protein